MHAAVWYIIHTIKPRFQISSCSFEENLGLWLYLGYMNLSKLLTLAWLHLHICMCMFVCLDRPLTAYFKWAHSNISPRLFTCTKLWEWEWRATARQLCNIEEMIMLNMFVACMAADKSICYEFDSRDNSCAILVAILNHAYFHTVTTWCYWSNATVTTCRICQYIAICTS